MTARVRPMEAADLERVQAIAMELEQAPRWHEAAYRELVDPGEGPPRVALVAEVAGELVGFAVASVVEPEAELESIGVAEGWQRRGIGLELFAGIEAALRQDGVHRVALEVRASNEPALGLYRRLGFEDVGRRPGYYADPVEDARVMRKDLTGPGNGPAGVGIEH